ncbi:hypothetical protein ACFVU3_37345 [Streptomyces sp. NPDC058052]|uniref:hypothetical protein n=1 Tax=Streptomyces sp. NPDC058052 TaxID=3346316 RepID=UPI0036E7ADFE
MTTTPAGPDPTMEATSHAVTEGQTGNRTAARQTLLNLWSAIGFTGDPLHRRTLAHHPADLYKDPAQALAWDIRALDAADAMTEQRPQNHPAGFHPSLHLNLADNYRRPGTFQAATEHINATTTHATALPQNPYNDLLHHTIQQVTWAITRQDQSPRTSPPGSRT